MLAGLVDGVIVVASAGTTGQRQLAPAIARLQQVEAPILGTVLNRSQMKDEGDYSYGYERPHTPPALADEPGGVAPSDERVS